MNCENMYVELRNFIVYFFTILTINLDVSVQDIKTAQSHDETLVICRKNAESEKKLLSGTNNISWFYYENGLLFRKFQSPKINDNKLFNQLVVPKQYRQTVMKLAHDCILSGHLGTKKTTDRVLSSFYWPGIQSDISRYCKSCDVCQRTLPKGRVQRVPLVPMPLIDTPFERVAVDLVGPIAPITDRGNRYILTLVDYSTRYPEAVALKSIETERVAEALVDMFTRVGIPKEILSDMGTQFTSSLMKEIGRLLSIKQLNTTPYHPACNGLVEKFNGTLKQMLRRMSAERPKDWDRYLPALLFAYREAPQESLGFSPFELLYGRTVRGPMSVLREIWTNEEHEPDVKTTYQYVLDLKERLASTCEMAQKELKKSSARYKKYYDKKSKRRIFVPNDKVLILLPTDKNKLLMQWKGPYNVVERKGVADYRIDMDGKVKTFHANLLKKYTDRNQMLLSEAKSDRVTLACAIIEPENRDPSELSLNQEELLNILPLKASETYKDVDVSVKLSPEQKNDIDSVLLEFQDILTDLPGRTSVAQHEIHLTTDDPITNRPYQVPFALRDSVRNEIKQMLKMDIIEPSESPYASSIVVAKKPDGSLRICVDFRKLNTITVFDAEPMPDPDEIFSKISKSQYFTKIDLCKGYWQIAMNPEHKDLTSFVTPDGLFRFKVMPFGLKNAPATFNRMMRVILKGLAYTDSFLDDILLHTETWVDHVTELREVFQRLREANLNAKPSKCVVAYKRLEYLGHTVGDGTITPNDKKLEAIRNAPRPETKKQIRSFLGLIGFYRKFVPNFAAVAVPLTDLTRKGVPNKFEWKLEHESAFQKLKSMLIHSPVLRLPDLSKTFIVRSDASDYGIGSVLLQEHDGNKFPVAYASKKLSVHERGYSVIEKECLAIVWALEKFQLYLYGRAFVIETDHQPLTYLSKAKVSNGRLMRWALFLQSYHFRCVSIKGSDNFGADFLSRHV
ncbi:hypothetical protein FSP39_011646 [Pinctada imbricata]|uniref:Retrovirus-related Pol polyprotein from transposon 17.6 n=1 Tax=Pinctada imbricata TaxID=66713 RepID=A0AA88YD19_PINIB|nr:hypothetical protein FSP39_011646 [Pinctada imbricata]